MRLIEGDCKAKGLQIFLLVEQVGQLLLPADTKHTQKCSYTKYVLEKCVKCSSIFTEDNNSFATMVGIKLNTNVQLTNILIYIYTV